MRCNMMISHDDDSFPQCEKSGRVPRTQYNTAPLCKESERLNEDNSVNPPATTVIGKLATCHPTHRKLCLWIAVISPCAAGQTAFTIPHLPPVVVRSTLHPQDLLHIPASISRLDSQRLHTGRPALDLSESLAAVPGMQAQHRHNAAQDLQISIRGFGARSTFGIRGIRMYVDGIPATMPDGQGQLSNIDLPSVESVEVLRGPYSALYGNSAGGVLRIDTAPGKGRPQLRFDGLTGRDGLQRYGVQASGATDAGMHDYRLSVNRTDADGYRDHSAMRKYVGNARLGFSVGDDSTLTLVANHVDIVADDPLGLTAADVHDRPRSTHPNAQRYNTRKTVKQTQLGLQLATDLNARHSLQIVTYGGQRSTVQFQAIPSAAQANPRHAGGVIDLKRVYSGADVRWTAQGDTLTWVSGIAYDHMRETRRGFENFIGKQLGVKGALRRDERNTLENLDPYAQLTLAWTPHWSLQTGLRYSTVRFQSLDHYMTASNVDDSGSAKYQAWLPVLALRYAASSDTSVHVTAGRGFETPTFNEISYRPDGTGGLNFALQPSTSRNLEIGVKTRALGGLLTGAMFHIDTRDEIVSAGTMGGRATFRNAGKSRRQGLELSWSRQVLEHLHVTASATWLDAVLRNPQDGEGRRIPSIARQNAYAGVTWSPPQGWQGGVQWRASGRIYANTANTAAATGYAVAGLFAGYKLALADWDVDAFVRVDNVFDRRYVGSVIVNEGNQRYHEPAAGRHWNLSLAARYRF